MGSNGRVGRPTAGDSEETRRRIVEAARVRFARDGYRATTNKLIAGDVGITPTAIYHYVDSKAALYAAVYCDVIDLVYTKFERAAAAESHLLARFSAVLRTVSRLQVADPTIAGFIGAVAHEIQQNPDLDVLLTPQRGRHQRFFTELVAEAAAAGELQPGVDEQALADLLGAVLTGVARIVTLGGDPDRAAGAIDALEQFFAGDLLRPPS
jgi:AcrR family transcriptional regulator